MLMQLINDTPEPNPDPILSKEKETFCRVYFYIISFYLKYM